MKRLYVKDIPKNKRNELKLPTKLTENLAYLSGIIAGDGHIRHSNEKYEYFILCEGHPIDEKDFYDNIIVSLFEELFNIKVKAKMRSRGTTYGIKVNSKALVFFFSNVIGLPTGRKSDIISIPEIFEKNEKLKNAFIRGLADTDFCLTLKRRYRKIQYYPVIVGASKSKKIMSEIAKYLESKGIVVSRDFDRPVFDERVNKYVTVQRFQLYGHNQLLRWMSLIGFRNPKHLKKYRLWKERNKSHSWSRIRKVAGSGFEPLT